MPKKFGSIDSEFLFEQDHIEPDPQRTHLNNVHYQNHILILHLLKPLMPISQFNNFQSCTHLLFLCQDISFKHDVVLYICCPQSRQLSGHYIQHRVLYFLVCLSLGGFPSNGTEKPTNFFSWCIFISWCYQGAEDAGCATLRVYPHLIYSHRFGRCFCQLIKKSLYLGWSFSSSHQCLSSKGLSIMPTCKSQEFCVTFSSFSPLGFSWYA